MYYLIEENQNLAIVRYDGHDDYNVKRVFKWMGAKVIGYLNYIKYAKVVDFDKYISPFDFFRMPSDTSTLWRRCSNDILYYLLSRWERRKFSKLEKKAFDMFKHRAKYRLRHYERNVS